MNVEITLTVQVNAVSIADGISKVQTIIESDQRKVQADVISIDRAKEAKR